MNYNLIKARIVEKGLTQKEIAEKLNLSEITISNWCRGKLGNIEKFILLCILIDLDIRDIKKD